MVRSTPGLRAAGVPAPDGGAAGVPDAEGGGVLIDRY
jgi:hypothetical protein